MCIDFLEEHGKRMSQAMKALGEEEEEFQQAPDISSTQANVEVRQKEDTVMKESQKS
jgi:hypothetical protein